MRDFRVARLSGDRQAANELDSRMRSILGFRNLIKRPVFDRQAREAEGILYLYTCTTTSSSTLGFLYSTCTIRIASYSCVNGDGG